ncbi:hypothetical protein FRB96_001303 [Tulasnella sp. 330]|nr:hypothetical protein FRB96_001303 [Tulasnella sp. 330]
MLWSALLTILPLWAGLARGQATTNATCSSSSSWMDNQLGQSPCLVAAVCIIDGQWEVSAITSGLPYSGPKGIYANACQCCTVTYNLLQACATCQGGGIGTWTDWVADCKAPVSGYPESTPGGTSIPDWAYLDPRTNNTWNAVVAEQNATGQSVTSSASSSTSSATGVAPSASSTTPATSSSTKVTSLIGPIVGGGLGGIALIGLFGFGIYFCLRHRSGADRGQKVITVPYGTEYGPSHAYTGTDGPSYAMGVETPMFMHNGSHPSVHGSRPSFHGSRPSLKLYDPGDPATFPVTPAPTYMSRDRNISGDTQPPLSPSSSGGQPYAPDPPLYPISTGPLASPGSRRHSLTYMGAPEM